MRRTEAAESSRWVFRIFGRHPSSWRFGGQVSNPRAGLSFSGDKWYDHSAAPREPRAAGGPQSFLRQLVA